MEIFSHNEDDEPKKPVVFLLLKKTKGFIFELSLKKDDKTLSTVFCVSGVPSKQVFRLAADSKEGSLEPIPQGSYDVSKPIWAGSKNDFKKVFSEALGPVKCRLSPKQKTKRTNLEIHWDFNRTKSPGTAGCVGIIDKQDLVKFLSWFDNPETTPHTLVVDWGLKSELA